MAKNGSFNTTEFKLSDGTLYLVFSWEIKSQSIENNTTVIDWTLKGGGTSTQWAKTGAIKVFIDGISVYAPTGTINLKSGGAITSGTHTVNHNDDGTGKFTASVQAGIYYYTSSNSTGSATFTPDTIARASQPSLVTYPETTNDVGDFGVEFGIHMNRKSSDFTHTVRYEYGERSGVIARNVETGVRWAVPLEFMNDIPNDTSGSGRIYVDTYNGSTFVGTKYTGFTATVPASVKPTCTVQVLDDTNTQATYGNLVKGLSKLYVKTNFYPAYSSPVNSYSVTANGIKYSKSEIVTGVLAAAGTTTVTATVTDKRGRTSAQASASFPVVDYAPPKITAISVHRCNADGTVNDRGEFVEVVFSGEVSPINNKNTAVYSVRYKKSTDDSWTTLTEDVNGWKPSDLNNNYAVYNQSYIFAADGSSSYDVEVSVADNHGSDSRPTSASTAFTLINFHPSGDALRFGGVAEEKNSLQNDLTLIQTGNQYCFSSIGAASTDGYILMARITVTETNSDTPITFVFSRRKAQMPMTVHICFNATDDTDPGLASIRYEGDNYEAFLTSPTESVWDLYVRKVNNSDTITLNRWHTSYRQMKRINVDFIGSIEETVPLGRFGYYRATPAVLESLIDFVLPVGIIIQLYSHADPNTMYPGTTWVRIENSFLWATDSKGAIGNTGGEKTHKLTAAESGSPNHTHTATYSGADFYIRHGLNSGTESVAAGTNTSVDKAVGATWATGFSTSTYSHKLDRVNIDGTVSVSGGATDASQAHNNMPPYTQVSVWRRTA